MVCLHHYYVEIQLTFHLLLLIDNIVILLYYKIVC